MKQYFEGRQGERMLRAMDSWEPPMAEGECPYPEGMIEQEHERGWLLLKARIQLLRKRRLRTLRRWRMAAAAAVLLIVTGAGWMWWQSHTGDVTLAMTEKAVATKVRIAASAGETRRVMLPDGSTVQLNRNTCIAYDEKAYGEPLREVWIENGEAFFEVTKDEGHPFVVHTAGLTTTVRGTSFNVQAYEDWKQQVVTVCTGRVEVEAADGRGAKKSLLTADRQLVYNETDRTWSTATVNAANAIGWTEGRFTLCNASPQEFCRRMEQQFGGRVRLADRVMEGAKINLSFPQKATQREVLDAVCVLYGAHYDATANKDIRIEKNN